MKKGAPLGQMTRNFYTQELGVLKNSKDFVKHTQAQHLDEVNLFKNSCIIWGSLTSHDICWWVISWQVMCGVYRDGGSGYGGPAADEKFFDPERVIIKISYNYLGLREFTHFELWGYLTIHYL